MKDNERCSSPGSDSRISASLAWIDALKALALLWIISNHIIENVFGGPYFANPSRNWPVLAERIQQITPIQGGNSLDSFILNIARYAGWLGDQGVQLFLVLSGFGLAYGCLRSSGKSPLDIRQFYFRRFFRIFPLWWGAHLLFLLPSMLSGDPLSLGSKSFYLSFLGFRATTGLMYYYSPAWWYIGLLIQLYLVFPLLWSFMMKQGPVRFFCWVAGLGLAIRLLGLLYFDQYLDAWSRGAILFSRLPEFAFGMTLAFLYQESLNGNSAYRINSLHILNGCWIYILANALSFTLCGMTLAPLLQGIALCTILLPALRGEWGTRFCSWKWIQWTGKHSYALFLVHHPLILYFPTPSGESITTIKLLAYGFFMLIAMYVFAIMLEWIVGKAEGSIRLVYQRRGRVSSVAWVSAACVIPIVILIGAELTVRYLNPQEILGWGERNSLEPHPTYGWRLKPNISVRLRWSSYDYTVTSNEQGFPAPSFPREKQPNTFRIMTIGDAFTSAEGVDTSESWPRLLEKGLNQDMKGPSTQVLNYAVTGYGPNQYAAVLKDKIPEYHPDLVVIECFVNDFFDVQTSGIQFIKSIGYDLPSQSSMSSILRMNHLSSLFLNEVKAPLKELIKREPNPLGYFLGNFQSLEISNLEKMRLGSEKIKICLQEIKQISDAVKSKLIVLLVPAPVQICGPMELDYYPRGIDLSDTKRFSLEQPQTLLSDVTDSLGIQFIDLRAPLRGNTSSQPYQRKNMHFTRLGHEIVSHFIKDEIIREMEPKLVDGQAR